jgi:hypothetical protein
MWLHIFSFVKDTEWACFLFIELPKKVETWLIVLLVPVEDIISITMAYAERAKHVMGWAKHELHKLD